MRAAPLAELGRSAPSRAPAIAGAPASVLMVVTNGERRLRRICFPPILMCP